MKNKKKRYYAVRVGKKPGIYTSEAEFIANVNGFSFSEAKAFGTRDEAERYMRDGADAPATPGSIGFYCPDLASDLPYAFTDGSYADDVYSYGVLFLERSRNGLIRETELSGCEKDPLLLPSRNVAGETVAAIKAMQLAVVKGYSRLRICYDCTGIGEWATGKWRPIRPVAVKYVKEYQQIKDALEVQFEKVPAHAGNPYNTRADLLAKAGRKVAPQIHRPFVVETTENLALRHIDTVMVVSSELRGMLLSAVQDNYRKTRIVACLRTLEETLEAIRRCVRIKPGPEDMEPPPVEGPELPSDK